jgi:NADH:ubiquinone oxidoreductase subunit 2 (subunit N)
MNKKKIVKILSIALMVVMIAMCLQNVVLADMPDPSTIKGTNSGSTYTKFNSVLNTVLGLAQVIGVAVAIIMLIVLAIKYISSAPNDKAEIKKHAVMYIVGAIVLFGASGLLQIIKNFANETVNN